LNPVPWVGDRIPARDFEVGCTVQEHRMASRHLVLGNRFSYGKVRSPWYNLLPGLPKLSSRRLKELSRVKLFRQDHRSSSLKCTKLHRYRSDNCTTSQQGQSLRMPTPELAQSIRCSIATSWNVQVHIKPPIQAEVQYGPLRLQTAGQ